MPATEHQLFIAPPDPQVRLWRYMDFTKYVWLLERRALFFARADSLGDPFEGGSTHLNASVRPDVYRAQGIPEHIVQQTVAYRRWAPQWTYVSCWHMNEHESAAMWRLYARTNEAIAIQTRFARLKAELPPEAYLGTVNYIDYHSSFIPENNTLAPFVHKRLSFEHEREVRAVIQVHPTEEDSRGGTRGNLVPGLEIPFEIGQGIERISVAPTASQWFFELVRNVTQKYELDLAVTRSSLDDAPVISAHEPPSNESLQLTKRAIAPRRQHAPARPVSQLNSGVRRLHTSMTSNLTSFQHALEAELRDKLQQQGGELTDRQVEHDPRDESWTVSAVVAGSSVRVWLYEDGASVDDGRGPRTFEGLDFACPTDLVSAFLAAVREALASSAAA